MKRKQSNRSYPIFIIALCILGIAGTILLSHKKNSLNQYAAGNDLYVSPSGNDANSGTQTNPFKTIQKGADNASAGTTVHVAPGSYGAFIINNSGTNAAPITIISDTKWGAKITTSGGLRDFPVRNNGSYVHIIGFDITSSTSWIGILTYGQHNIIQGNHVHDLTGMSCTGSPGGTGIGDDSSASDNIFIGNIVNNIGSYPTKCDYVHGIYPDGAGDIIENNIAYNNAGNGLYCNHGVGSMLFVNNLSFANGEYGIGINGVSGATGNIIENNIIIGNSIAGIKTWSTVSNTQINNNILFNNSSNFVLDGSATQTQTITSDPKLVNYQSDGTGDYHLTSSSPAINAGVSANSPSIDFDGNTRPQGSGIDIGPFEYGATNGGTSPTVTTVVSSSVTPSVTQTNETMFNITALLHGIGKGGDNLNANSGGNMTPAHTHRNATITLTDTAGNPHTGTGIVTYNSTNGNYTGNLSIGGISSGQYTAKVKTDGFLAKQVPSILAVTSTATLTLPSIAETTGDVNNDNQLDILDYNMIVSCYGSKMTSSGCTAPITSTSPGADINDDGAINGADYNLFLRELSVQTGN